MGLEGVTVTDGGLETSLLFGEGFELPCFATFPLLESEAGRSAMRRYFELLGGCCGTDHRHVAEILAAWDIS